MDMMQPDPGSTGAGLRCLSNQTTLCEADASAGCHDDVIDDADIHKRESVSNFPGDELVGRTGLRHTARVIVRQDARRCISPKRFLGGVNYFFRSRLSFLPVFGPHHRSPIGQPDAEGVRSSC
jgi:hypothetical protein